MDLSTLAFPEWEEFSMYDAKLYHQLVFAAAVAWGVAGLLFLVLE